MLRKYIFTDEEVSLILRALSRLSSHLDDIEFDFCIKLERYLDPTISVDSGPKKTPKESFPALDAIIAKNAEREGHLSKDEHIGK